MTKKEDPARPGAAPTPPAAPPAAPHPGATLQFGPTPSPPGSRLKTGRK